MTNTTPYDERLMAIMERLIELLEAMLRKGSRTRLSPTGDPFEEELSPNDLKILMGFLREVVALRVDLRKEATQEVITISREQLALLYEAYGWLAGQVAPAKREKVKLEAIRLLREIFSEPGSADQDRRLLQGS